MFVSRYPLSIVAADPAQVQRRVRPALTFAVAWVAMTALLPLALETKTQTGARAIAAKTGEPAAQPVRKERLVAFSSALLWPFGLTPAKAMSLDVDELTAAKPAGEEISTCMRTVLRAQQGVGSEARRVSIRS